MVTITFDDGWVGQATIAAPRLEQRGWRGTFYLVPQWFDRQRDGESFMSVEQARALALAGHEIGDHTMTHQHLPTLSPEGIRRQMVECRGFLADRLGIPPEAITSFASPYGDYDGVVLGHARTLFSSHRTTNGELNTPATDPYLIGSVSLGVGHHGHPVHSNKDIARYIATAASEKEWLVLLVHGIVEGTPFRATDTHVEDFDAMLDQIQLNGLRVVTMREGADELRDLQGDESATEEDLDMQAEKTPDQK